MTYITPIQVAVRHTESAVAAAQAAIDEWTGKLADDPIYAMEWSDHLWQAVWTLKVHGELLAALKHDDRRRALAHLRDFFKTEVMRGARNPCRSTSDGSRLSLRAKMEVMASVVDDWEWTFGQVDAPQPPA